LPLSSFTRKQLRVTFTLTNNNAQFNGGGNVLTMTGLRMLATIKGTAMPAFPEATLKVWGMAQADMNSLAIVQVQGGKPDYSRNTVLIEANSGSGWSVAFAGQIVNAGPDYDAVPAVCLSVQAITGGFDLLNPAQPTSYSGAADVATIVSNIAAKLGVAFQNDGVAASLSNPYFSGTLSEQLRRVCQQANIDAAWEDTGGQFTDATGDATPTGLIVITPKGVARQVDTIVLSPQTGLVGYPKVLGNGYLNARSLYNPQFRTLAPVTIQGSDVVIDPNLPKTLNSLADGSWVVGPLTNTLSAEMPNGPWFTDMLLYPPGAVPGENT
jgi:hypothetical protein